MIRNTSPSAFFLNRIFTGRDERLLFAIVSLTGLAGSMFGARLLEGFNYNFGRPVAGLFVPPFFCLIYVTFCGLRYKLTPQVLLKTAVLFGLQLIPFIPLFFQKVVPTAGDDFSRYYLYAGNMFEQNTLWGGDKLFFRDAGYHYVTQPGYRYFVFLELFLFRDLYRFVFLINIGLYLLTAFFFQKAIIDHVSGRRVRNCLLILTLLFSPYLIKNLLMGLPEWFTVVLLMWVACCWFRRQELPAVLLLALVPFFRQNLLVAALLLFIYLITNTRQKFQLTCMFAGVLLLPLYHNLYYAGEWRFFVDVFQYPFFEYAEHNSVASGINYSLLLANIIHYAGFDIEQGKLVFSFIAAIFLPFATIIYFYLVVNLHRTRSRIIFLLITGSAIGPTILFGNAYYPRFELVNVLIAIVSFLFIHSYSDPDNMLPTQGSKLPDGS